MAHDTVTQEPWAGWAPENGGSRLFNSASILNNTLTRVLH